MSLLSQLALRAMGQQSTAPLAAALGPTLQQQMRGYAQNNYYHMDRNTERGACGVGLARSQSIGIPQRLTPPFSTPTDKKERDPTFRQAPKDLSASERGGGARDHLYLQLAPLLLLRPTAAACVERLRSEPGQPVGSWVSRCLITSHHRLRR